ncbi:NAD(P)-binding domain-containing protein [Gramella sp. GC03-9]|uniref:NAD(P)-binding domain-containing protein n=1 Tax=Christiangramia oceanisediminis TaxID=2920386 RepID=A0A9X2I3U9_9FLAO|nr:NAD(P)-binding domain-containing protein [Gramella oceanisediminis]MCP9198857.1 NAD(P)-binding domain-containing protein [Gramella oceanisediminis]
MKIGVLGVGSIGKTLALKLPKAGHEVEVANSRGPEYIDETTLVTGAKPVTAEQAVEGKDVIILSIPLNRVPEIKPLLAKVPQDVTVIDTSNYYPSRDNKIAAIDDGQVESLWVSEQLGRPIAKAWNAIGYISFEKSGKPAGSPDRIAIPIAADREQDRKIAMQLVNDTGFDAFYAGSLADSWRQQPGSPVYCTDLSLQEIEELIDTAERERLPKRRDLAVAAVVERLNGKPEALNNEFLVGLNRILYM